MLDYAPSILNEERKNKLNPIGEISFSKQGEKEETVIKPLLPSSIIKRINNLSTVDVTMPRVPKNIESLISIDRLKIRESEIIEEAKEIKETIKDILYKDLSDKEILEEDSLVFDDIKELKFDATATVYILKIMSVVRTHIEMLETSINAISYLKLEIEKLKGDVTDESGLNSIMPYKKKDIDKMVALAKEISEINSVKISLTNSLKHLGALKRVRKVRTANLIEITSDITERLDDSILRLVRSYAHDREINSMYLGEMIKCFKLAKSFFNNNDKEMN